MSTAIKELRDLKKGDKAFRLMERHNPQLGTYYSWTTGEVARNPKTTVLIEIYGTNHSFDVETGVERKKSKSVYGSSYYSLFTESQMKVESARLIANGCRVNGLPKESN